MNYHPPVTVDITGTISTVWYRSCSSLKKRMGNDSSHGMQHERETINIRLELNGEADERFPD
jgi:hypothetical protein